MLPCFVVSELTSRSLRMKLVRLCGRKARRNISILADSPRILAAKFELRSAIRHPESRNSITILKSVYL